MSSSRPPFSRDHALAFLLGLHGLALMVVFPLGPQEARLWHPGVPGVAALAAAFPLAAALAGLVARRLPRLTRNPRSLAALAVLATLPCALSFDHPSLVAARVFAGLVTGLSLVAIHRALPVAASPLVSRIAPRIVAFGMPACILTATLLDWRFAFLPILVGQLGLLLAPSVPAFSAPAQAAAPLTETAPWGLVATASLAFVTAAYLTVLSGFLVFNAGHTEFHIPAVLLSAALLGLVVPPLVGRLRSRLGPVVFYAVALAASLLTLLALLALQGPLAAPLAIAAIALFLVVGSTRQLALAQLVSPAVPPDALAAHQTHNQLALHFGSGLGALVAGRLVFLSPQHTLAGMPALFAASLLATGLAFFAGLAVRRKNPALQRNDIPSPAEMPSSRIRASS